MPKSAVFLGEAESIKGFFLGGERFVIRRIYSIIERIEAIDKLTLSFQPFPSRWDRDECIAQNQTSIDNSKRDLSKIKV